MNEELVLEELREIKADVKEIKNCLFGSSKPESGNLPMRISTWEKSAHFARGGKVILRCNHE